VIKIYEYRFTIVDTVDGMKRGESRASDDVIRAVVDTNLFLSKLTCPRIQSMG
jgi:hypothetical protein